MADVRSSWVQHVPPSPIVRSAGGPLIWICIVWCIIDPRFIFAEVSVSKVSFRIYKASQSSTLHYPFSSSPIAERSEHHLPLCCVRRKKRTFSLKHCVGEKCGNTRIGYTGLMHFIIVVQSIKFCASMDLCSSYTRRRDSKNCSDLETTLSGWGVCVAREWQSKDLILGIETHNRNWSLAALGISDSFLSNAAPEPTILCHIFGDHRLSESRFQEHLLAYSSRHHFTNLITNSVIVREPERTFFTNQTWTWTVAVTICWPHQVARRRHPRWYSTADETLWSGVCTIQYLTRPKL